jgi:putative NADPH-quinone reductase
MVSALVVFAHPVPDSFTASMRDSVVGALRSGGHQVDLADLYADGFDPRLTADEHANHRLGVEHKPVAAAWADRLRACDTLVLVYPTWWSAQPAMLKGWFERVWVNGVAVAVHDDGRVPSPLLTNIRRVITVTTHGSSKLVNSLQGEPGKRFVKRALRSAVNRRCRVEWIAFYGNDRSGAQQRTRFLQRVTRRFERMS